MEWQAIFNLLGSAATGVIGWFANTIWNAHKELRAAHENHRVEVARDYVPRSSLAESMRDIKSALQRIEDKLDSKADK